MCEVLSLWYNLIMNHSEARKKVCVICYNKGSRPLSKIDVVAIQSLVIDNYDPQHPDFPCAICTPCHGILTEHRNGTKSRTLPVADDYNPGVQILTHAQPNCCC